MGSFFYLSCNEVLICSFVRSSLVDQKTRNDTRLYDWCILLECLFVSKPSLLQTALFEQSILFNSFKPCTLLAVLIISILLDRR